MKNKRVIAIIVIVLVLIIGGYYGVRALTGGNKGALTASGTIEATTVNVSPELAGKVDQVMVQEGDQVQAGAPLFRLDATLLEAQRNVATSALNAAKASVTTAQTALDTAQAQYDITLNTALGQDTLKQRTSDWTTATQADFIQPKWYFNEDEQVVAAQAAVDAAQQSLLDEQAKLATLETSQASANFVKAESDMAEAQANYVVAKRLNDQVSNGKDINDLTTRGLFLLARDTKIKNKGGDPKWLGNNLDNELRTAAQKIFDDAKAKLTETQTAYLDAINSEGAISVLEERGSISVAQERYYRAEDLLRSLQTGNNSPELTAAQKALEQAKSTADQATSAVSEAQANLDLLNAQMDKLEVDAPLNGVVLTRNIEPGEYVQPGADAMSMANISSLTITVYVPEDRYGEISLGLKASVSVDSFPGAKFSGVVSNISDQAEFTPRNVQTVEGRSSTVYAIKLNVNDPQGKLKPGMPADVVFNTK
jgi:multidrug resistance efflux pump